jgi:aspartate/methionine/tyrosine aminotransferase
MLPAPFALERFFAQYEFSARYLLSAADCQPLSMRELVAGADGELRRRWESLRLGYTDSQGLPELRREVACLHDSVTAGQVVIATPEEAIFLSMHALLAPGDHVVCTFPGYQSLYEVARSIGCQVDLWEPVEGTAWYFDPVRLQSLLRPDTKLVVWNFPHNPTGALPSPGDYSLMVESVAEVGAWLFSDETYRLLEPDAGLRLPPAVNIYERAASLGGMSKAFGLAGLRIGWATAHDDDLLERIKSLKDYTTICSSAPSELLALMALRSKDSILAANVARIDSNRLLAASFFERHQDLFEWAPPQAGPVCFPRLLTAAGAEVFCARLLERTGVLLLPSTVFEFGDSHFRLGLGRDDFRSGLAVLEDYLE